MRNHPATWTHHDAIRRAIQEALEAGAITEPHAFALYANLDEPPDPVVDDGYSPFVLEIVVDAKDLDHAGALAHDAADFLSAAENDVTQWEAHPFEPIEEN